MNPVDHVREPCSTLDCTQPNLRPHSPTEVVTTSTSVKPRRSTATPYKVKRPVSSPPGELVCFAVRRRRRTRCISNGNGVVWVIFQRFSCVGTGSFTLCSLAQLAERGASSTQIVRFQMVFCWQSRPIGAVISQVLDNVKSLAKYVLIRTLLFAT